MLVVEIILLVWNVLLTAYIIVFSLTIRKALTKVIGPAIDLLDKTVKKIVNKL